MKKVLKVVFIIILIVVAIAGIFIYQGYDRYKKAIEEISIEEKVEEIKSNKNYTKISDMPQIYLDAVIAVEDHRFYEHNGVDIVAISRAVVNDIKAFKLEEGGSTITQQLAKNIYFTQEKTLNRKIAEIFMAIELEKNLEKDEILELYLNTSYFGEGNYTVKEASEFYFGKEPIEMTDYEATLLAGIPNAPSVYAPTKNPELARQRQKQVITQMVKYEYLTDEEADKILSSKDDD